MREIKVEGKAGKDEDEKRRVWESSFELERVSASLQSHVRGPCRCESSSQGSLDTDSVVAVVAKPNTHLSSGHSPDCSISRSRP